MTMGLELGQPSRPGNRITRRGRATPLHCVEVAGRLGAVEEGTSAPGSIVSHVERCLFCQAELARYHKLFRLLHQLRTNDVSPPDGLVADILSAVEAAASRSAVRSVLTGRRLAYAGAVTAAGGAAAALLLLARAKRSEQS